MSFIKSRYLKEGGEAAEEPKPVRDFRQVDFETEARRVLDEALEKGARIERAAYRAGFAKGEEAGIRLGKEQLAPQLDQLEQTLRSLSQAREEMLKAMEGKITLLAAAIAAKIVHITVDASSEVIRATCREAIAQSVDRGELIIHLAPSESRIIEELRPDLLKIKGVDSVTLVADPKISPGGCRIETSAGGIDATVETALNEIRTLVE